MEAPHSNRDNLPIALLSGAWADIHHPMVVDKRYPNGPEWKVETRSGVKAGRSIARRAVDGPLHGVMSWSEVICATACV
jgi:hypothetical protein